MSTTIESLPVRVRRFVGHLQRCGYIVTAITGEYVIALRFERGEELSKVQGQIMFRAGTGGYRGGFVMPDFGRAMVNLPSRVEAERKLFVLGTHDLDAPEVNPVRFVDWDAA